ncbi:MAG: GNAT family N-acetyltransferase [Anaerolineales bacterium]
MSASPITLKVGQDLPTQQIVYLYNSVGWITYTSTEQLPKLQQAIRNSSYVVTAWSGENLIGMARCVSDDVSIAYLQDILVDPAYQR